MNNDDVRATITKIIDGGDALGAAYAREHIGSQWLWNIFERVVLLMGEDSAIASDLSLTDEARPTGWILVVTEKALIRATFTNPERVGPEFQHQVQCERVPVSAVTRVTADVAWGGGDDQRAWPRRAQISLLLDRELTGETALRLPSRTHANEERALAVARVLSILR